MAQPAKAVREAARRVPPAPRLEPRRQKERLERFRAISQAYIDDAPNAIARNDSGYDGPTEMEVRVKREANTLFMEEVLERLHSLTTVIRRQRRRLGVTYWLYMVLNVLLFLVGLALLALPMVQMVRTSDVAWSGVLAGATGLGQLVLLLVFKPFQQIQAMMGNMSQVILALESQTMETVLRLVEFDIDDRPTLGKAALDIRDATAATVELIQRYVEEGAGQDTELATVVNRLAATPSPVAQGILADLRLPDATVKRLTRKRLIPSGLLPRVAAKVPA